MATASVAKLPVLPKEIAFSFKAMKDGAANDGQQISTIEYILADICEMGKTSFVQGDPYATAFNEGKKFVGHVIASAIMSKAEAKK